MDNTMLGAHPRRNLSAPGWEELPKVPIILPHVRRRRDRLRPVKGPKRQKLLGVDTHSG
jgi:hypothetical protein